MHELLHMYMFLYLGHRGDFLCHRKCWSWGGGGRGWGATLECLDEVTRYVKTERDFYSQQICLKCTCFIDKDFVLMKMTNSFKILRFHSEAAARFLQLEGLFMFLLMLIKQWFLFLRLGCPNFTYPSFDPTPVGGTSCSMFFPDQAIYQGHPRFR